MNNYDFYKFSNSVAKKNSTVIFGAANASSIPATELSQSLGFNFTVYNRSLANLSVRNAKASYFNCAECICPEAVILQLGENDLDLFKSAPEEFDKLYLDFISYLKSTNSQLRIQLVSIENSQRNSAVSDMNRHIKAIADSEKCEFFNVETAKLWNPDATLAASFMYESGFESPLKIKRPLYDVSKALFSYIYACSQTSAQDERKAV